MQKHGEYFPGVNSLDDLIEQMQQQMMAMQGIMDNLSPEQRQERLPVPHRDAGLRRNLTAS